MTKLLNLNIWHVFVLEQLSDEMCPSCSIEGCGSDVLDAVVVVIWLQNNTLGIN